MRILVIEDHALVREGLVLALQTLGDGEDSSSPAAVCGAKDAEEATRLLEQNDDFDLALLDLMLPGVSGLAYLGVLRKRFPHIPVVILSAVEDAETVDRVMRLGAAGYVSKASPTDVLIEALRQVLAGEIWLPAAYCQPDGQPNFRIPGRARRAKTVAERFALTDTQARVMDLLAEGKANREIAVLLGVTEGTVKVHVSAILKAMGVSSRSQALLVAQGRKPV